jgi:hypothetical protein
LRHGVLDLAMDEGAELRLGFSGEARGEEHDSAQRTRFAIHSGARPLVVSPDLDGHERNQEAEDDA